MIIFLDRTLEGGRGRIVNTRKSIGLNMTFIIEMEFSELPLYSQRSKIEAIQQRELNTPDGWKVNIF